MSECEVEMDAIDLQLPKLPGLYIYVICGTAFLFANGFQNNHPAQSLHLGEGVHKVLKWTGMHGWQSQADTRYRTIASFKKKKPVVTVIIVALFQKKYTCNRCKFQINRACLPVIVAFRGS